MLWYTFFTAFFGALGFMAYNFGIQMGNVSIVAAIGSANPLVAAIYGKLVYKEKLKNQQYIAIAVVILGIILMSL